MIQAAGYHRTVTEDADLITQAITEDPVALIRSGQIRPIELIAEFQIDPVSNSDPTALPDPFSVKITSHRFRDCGIQTVKTSLIPESVGDQDLAFSQLAKLEAGLKICIKIDIRVVSFEGMEGNVDFMECGSTKQHILLLNKITQRKVYAYEQDCDHGISGHLR